MSLFSRITATLLSATLALSLVGCNADSQETAPAGDVYSALYPTEITTFHYLNAVNTADLELLVNAIDPLVSYDNYGNLVPALAESWTSSEDNTVWIFSLRPDVAWVDYQGEEIGTVTAQDWVTSAHYLCDAANQSPSFSLYRDFIAGARDYYNYTNYLVQSEGGTLHRTPWGTPIPVVDSVDPDAIGVKALDNLTLQFTTSAPCPYFPSLLVNPGFFPVYAPYFEEMGRDFGVNHTTILYNGGYLVTEYLPQQHRTLEKNPAYWDAVQVHINTLSYTYHPEALTQAPQAFLQGEVDFATLDSQTQGQWLEDPDTSPFLNNTRPSAATSCYYTFNLAPKLATKYQPSNWALAVQNEAFRQSLLTGFHRANALAAQGIADPEALLLNTITPSGLLTCNGQDYTDFAPLQQRSQSDFFEEEQALAYKVQAMAELTAQGGTFPVLVYLPYDATLPHERESCLAMETQLERLLGEDYIDIVLDPITTEDFTQKVVASGNYALVKQSWSAQYADPLTWRTPFIQGSFAPEYAALLQAAVVANEGAPRYEAFASAEAFLLNHAYAIPFHRGNSGCVATRLEEFGGSYAPVGLVDARFKGKTLSDIPLSQEDYDRAYIQWQADAP